LKYREGGALGISDYREAAYAFHGHWFEAKRAGHCLRFGGDGVTVRDLNVRQPVRRAGWAVLG